MSHAQLDLTSQPGLSRRGRREREKNLKIFEDDSSEGIPLGIRVSATIRDQENLAVLLRIMASMGVDVEVSPPDDLDENPVIVLQLPDSSPLTDPPSVSQLGRMHKIERSQFTTSEMKRLAIQNKAEWIFSPLVFANRFPGFVLPETGYPIRFASANPSKDMVNQFTRTAELLTLNAGAQLASVTAVRRQFEQTAAAMAGALRQVDRIIPPVSMPRMPKRTIEMLPVSLGYRRQIAQRLAISAADRQQVGRVMDLARRPVASSPSETPIPMTSSVAQASGPTPEIMNQSHSVPPEVARMVESDLRRIVRQRYASVGPTALGGGMLCALVMIEAGLPFAWLGFAAGFVAMMSLSVWALDRNARNIEVGDAH